MSRYEKALIRYEESRQRVQKATRMINFWSYGKWIGDRLRNDHICKRPRLNSDSCIDLLWQASRNNKILEGCDCSVLSEDGCNCDCVEYIEPPELCAACRNVQRFVDLRKRRKQEFGAAKRQLSALAKTLISEQTKRVSK